VYTNVEKELQIVTPVVKTSPAYSNKVELHYVSLEILMFMDYWFLPFLF
jgi:hypothetical protein